MKRSRAVAAFIAATLAIVAQNQGLLESSRAKLAASRRLNNPYFVLAGGSDHPIKLPPSVQQAAWRVANAHAALASAVSRLAVVDAAWRMRELLTVNHPALTVQGERHPVTIVVKEWETEGVAEHSVRFPGGPGWWVYELRDSDKRLHPLGGPFNVEEDAVGWATGMWPQAVLDHV